MSTSVIKNHNRKTIIVYMAVTVLAILVNKIYGIFGHEVSSGYMTWMFLYPFLGGSIFYLLFGILLPKANRFSGYRLFYNCYNSGIALLTVGSFIKGIFEIAGTGSTYVPYYYIVGYLFLAVGLAGMVLSAVKGRTEKQLIKTEN